MKLTQVERLERLEDIIQEKIAHTEREIESIAHLKDACMARIRIMWLMDLGQLRQELIYIRRRLDLEYAVRKERDNYHDEIRRFVSRADLGGGHEADLQRGNEEPGAGARRGGGFQDVGRYDPYDPGDDEGGKERGEDKDRLNMPSLLERYKAARERAVNRELIEALQNPKL